MSDNLETLSPADLIRMYRMGLFPMAETRDDQSFSIVAPHIRALLPIDTLHIPKRLKRRLLQCPYKITVDTEFEQVIKACADARGKNRTETWINNDIISLFAALHRDGIAHSVECWNGDALVGGLYGLALGGTFCGESMFSLENDASKIALVHLCARLKRGGYSLLDAQFHNPHLEQFGLYEIEQDEYVAKMQSHLHDKTDFACSGVDEQSLLKEYLLFQDNLG